MANEFRIKNGFRSEGNSEITGSLIVSNSLDTLQGKLYYANGTSSINYKSGLLYDDFGVISADYRDTRELFDYVESSSLNWTNRQLVKTDGSVTVDWETATFTGSFTGSFTGDGSALTGISTYIDNLVTVGLPGSDTDYNSIKSAVDSIVDATATNTYTVRVSPGVYIENEMTVPSYVAVKGDSSISTIVSASNPSSSIFIMSDQSMVIDMQIQGSTAPSASAIIYSSPTTPQTNAIAYVENVRFGTNYTNAKVIGTGSNGNCILQCSNVKYGGFTELNKSFDVGFHVTRTGSAGIGRMQLRNVTSTNGGVTGSDNNQIFALSDAPGCAFIVNGCLLTRATGAATGTGFKVYNGGNLRLTGVNFQRWDKGIWAPQTGSGPSIDAIALNFENCTTDVAIEHTGSTGKVQGTDNFLKTQIALSSSLYEVGQDPRRITVGTKGADFTSISASVAYITDSSDSNRYVIEVGPGRYTEKEIDLTGKPYVSIVGSSIQTTQIFPSSSNQHLIKMGINNEISFLSLTNSPAGYSALYVDDVGDYAQAHKVSFYDCDTCLTVISRTQDTKFYGEYLDFNGVYSTGSFVSSSNGYQALASLENYYQFPVGATGLIANYGTGDVAELDLYAAGLIGESDATSVAIRLENGADCQGLGMDMPGWGSAVYIPNLANSASFNIVGSMIHDSVNYDFEILHPSASCRFQGTADHSKINNVSSNFYWTFLDETDGELDITRKLSVTFADGTHTDASTLIFEGSPMGVMSGGNITISGSLTITTAAGYGYLHNMGTEVFQRIDWADTNLTLSPNTDNYIFIDETATLTANAIQPDSAHNIILGRVVTNDTGIELVDNSPYFAAHMSNALSKFNRNALGPVFAQGCIVSEDVTPRQLDVTAGLYYFGENEYDPTGGSAITFTQYYQSGSGAFGWNKSSQTVVPNNVYNSGSALIAMSASYYTKHSLYTVGKGPDEEYFVVINPSQYATLVEAENAGLPTPPTYFSDGVVALASIYVQSGSANITQIQDIRPVIGFRAAGVNASSVHGNLLGLNADDHPQYLLANGTRPVNGTFTVMGSMDVTGSTIHFYPDTNFTIYDSTTNYTLLSVDVNGIQLNDKVNGNISVDVEGRTLFDSASNSSVNWNNRQLIKSDGTTVVFDWENAIITASLHGTASYVAAAGFNNEIQYNYNGSFAATGSFAFVYASESLQQGSSVIASGSYSHAEGESTIASGFASHAEGSSTVAYGSRSHAEGSGTVTFGEASHAEGYYTKTGGNNGYLATSITNGTASLSASYGDIQYDYQAGNYLYLNDADYDFIYGGDIFIILSASFNGTNTEIFIDNTVTTTTAVVGNLTTGINGWLGEQTYKSNLSHAEGSNTVTVLDLSHAEGGGTVAAGYASHAEGHLTTTIGSYSHAEGSATSAIGESSHAEGESTIASGFASHAEGSSAIASGAHSHAEGRGTIALGSYSHAEGNETIASGSYQHVSGKYNTHGNNTSLFIIGNGVNTSTRSDLALFNVDGIVFNQPVTGSIFSGSFQGDGSGLTGVTATSTPAGPNKSIQFNDAGSTSGSANFIFDKTTNTVVLTGSFNQGFANTISNDFSHAEGEANTVSGYASHVEGTANIATGYASHAEGVFTSASGDFSHAEGSGTVASGSTSHAEGEGTVAKGDISHTEGLNTLALGQASHAEGYLTTASGQYSHASGQGTIAYGVGQTALGKYNTNTNTTSLVVIGNGSNNASRSDLAQFNITNIVFNQPLTASVITSSFVGNLTGTASYATQALSASWAPGGGGVTINNNTDNYLVTATGTANTLNGESGLTYDGTTFTVGSAIRFVQGTNSTATVAGAFVHGNQATGSGLYSHAEGFKTQTLASSAHAEGALTIAIGAASHAEGSASVSFGAFSHADGIATIASGSGQFVTGKFNQHGDATSLFIVGNGANDSTRSDIFRITDTSVQVTGSLNVTAGITGSLQGTATSASFASTASYVNGMITKNNAVAGGSFTGNPKKATVTFSTAFPNTNYSITVTGEDARSWTIESKLAGSFVINSNSNTAIANNVYWQAISYGEFNG